MNRNIIPLLLLIIAANIACIKYKQDYLDQRIRKITPAALVTVLAGNGIQGFADGRADIAQFGRGFSIGSDEQGNIYVSDAQNKRIRKISITGKVTTIAGSGRTRIRQWQWRYGTVVLPDRYCHR